MRNLNRHFAKQPIIWAIQFAIFSCFLISCKEDPRTNFINNLNPATPVRVILQPISYQNEIPLDTIANYIRNFYHFETRIAPEREMPKAFLNTEKSIRYSADSIIRQLRWDKPDNAQLILGLTSLEIFTTKRNSDGTIKQPEHKYRAWAIFGLGYLGAPGCIVSTKRLRIADKVKFRKRVRTVILHELGHNLGLPHCPSPKCIMNDANETIATIDKSSEQLCTDCKKRTGQSD